MFRVVFIMLETGETSLLTTRGCCFLTQLETLFTSSPIRFWTREKHVHLTTKWLTPTRPKAQMLQYQAMESRFRSKPG